MIETHRDGEGRVYLKGWTEPELFSVVLREADEAGMDFQGFKVRDEDTLTQLSRDLRAWGVDVQEIPAGDLDHCGRRMQFSTPTGHRFELYATKTYTGPWGISEVEPEAWPRGLRGIRVQRFDHCQIHGRDIEAMRDLLSEVLGFYVTEHVIDDTGKNLAIFMSLAMKAHDVALILDDRHGTFHHAAFYVETWENLLRAGDLISMTGTSLDTAPTRHGITRGQTTYFFDPSGNRNEVFAGGSTHYPDQRPYVWHDRNIGKAIFYHHQKLSEKFMTALT
ncbi:catechol 2,3-dioxygenase [Sphingobium subterraneum]|uniref:Catechol 2,3-dioxygenase n=1 Tax=Sphingobium subterraneum TaxID=627688 RepID=A0A841IXP7_9SPHN|nr:catechol 2,3-dioxygenase [Sphingobium subterraneum]